MLVQLLDDASKFIRMTGNAMPEITEQTISCPYCGESISVLIDDSLPQQSYVEDCQVCCRPIVLDVTIDVDGDVTVDTRVENE